MPDPTLPNSRTNAGEQIREAAESGVPGEQGFHAEPIVMPETTLPEPEEEPEGK